MVKLNTIYIYTYIKNQEARKRLRFGSYCVGGDERSLKKQRFLEWCLEDHPS